VLYGHGLSRNLATSRNREVVGFVTVVFILPALVILEGHEYRIIADPPKGGNVAMVCFVLIKKDPAKE
jgi:hypothetical protein